MAKINLEKDGLPLAKLRSITHSSTMTGAIKRAVFFTIKHFKNVSKVEKENIELKRKIKEISYLVK